ncbi:MAG: hypothetical protein AMXMBFR58_32210 [Phycisphaerae bacterium]
MCDGGSDGDEEQGGIAVVCPDGAAIFVGGDDDFLSADAIPKIADRSERENESSNGLAPGPALDNVSQLNRVRIRAAPQVKTAIWPAVHDDSRSCFFHVHDSG